MTAGQKISLRDILPRYEIAPHEDAVDWDRVFHRRSPLVVEIGCGYGEALVDMAINDAGKNYVGFEVYPPALGALAGKIEQSSLDNVRIVNADARIYFAKMFRDDDLAAVCIFFPDPWQKRRQHKRRLINADFLESLFRNCPTAACCILRVIGRIMCRRHGNCLIRTGNLPRSAMIETGVSSRGLSNGRVPNREPSPT